MRRADIVTHKEKNTYIGRSCEPASFQTLLYRSILRTNLPFVLDYAGRQLIVERADEVCLSSPVHVWQVAGGSRSKATIA